MQQEVVLALLAKEPARGSQLRARLDRALGGLGEAINDGQIDIPAAGEVADDDCIRATRDRDCGALERPIAVT